MLICLTPGGSGRACTAPPGRGYRRRAYERDDPPWHYVTVSPPALLSAREVRARAVVCPGGDLLLVGVQRLLQGGQQRSSGQAENYAR